MPLVVACVKKDRVLLKCSQPIHLETKLGTEMALIKCSECKTEISSKAESCPKCGNPKTEKSNFFSEVLQWIIAVIIFVVILNYVL